MKSTVAHAATSSQTHASSPLTSAFCPGSSLCLAYHNGPVMADVQEVYTIFWFPTAFNQEYLYKSLVNQYYGDVGGNNLYNLLQQYPQGNGGYPSSAAFADTWNDPNNYPNSITQQDIVQQVTDAINENSTWTCHGTYTCYFVVYMGPDANAPGLISRHNYYYYGSDTTPTIYGQIFYDSASLQPSPNNCAACDWAVSYSAHEQFEAATDPLGDHVASSGWFSNNPPADGPEIADECDSQFGQVSTDGANQVWNGHPYHIQEMWDNSTSSCSQGLT